MTGSGFQEEVWSMAGQAGGNRAEGRSNGEAAQLAPSLSEVQLVEAFFDVEQRLGIAAAAAAHPAALPQVHACMLLKSHDKSEHLWIGGGEGGVMVWVAVAHPAALPEVHTCTPARHCSATINHFILQDSGRCPSCLTHLHFMNT